MGHAGEAGAHQQDNVTAQWPGENAGRCSRLTKDHLGVSARPRPDTFSVYRAFTQNVLGLTVRRGHCATAMAGASGRAVSSSYGRAYAVGMSLNNETKMRDSNEYSSLCLPACPRVKVEMQGSIVQGSLRHSMARRHKSPAAVICRTALRSLFLMPARASLSTPRTRAISWAILSWSGFNGSRKYTIPC